MVARALARAKVDWRALIARLDAEDGADAEDAVFMASVVNMFRGCGDDAAAMGAPGARCRRR